MEITVKIKCPCETDACACCACVSMHCDECHDHSEFQQGSYCSHCGRPLKAELQRNYVPKSEVKKLEAEVERLTTIINSYALQYGTVVDKEVFLKKARAEGAKEIANSIKTYYDHIDKTVGALINYTIDQKLKEFLGEGGGKENG